MQRGWKVISNHSDGLTDLSDAAVESLTHKSGDINWEDPEDWAEEFKQNR
jgi:hypothetical protein